jgi:hypothetical protein
MASDPRDYKLDLSSGADDGAVASSGHQSRPFLSVRFACCNTYARIYRRANEQSYHGRCPRCGLPVSFRVGQDGTDARFFVVH